MAKVKKDPYKVIMRQTKLPISLLNERAKVRTVEYWSCRLCINSFLTDDDSRRFCGWCKSRPDGRKCALWSLIYSVHIFILDYNEIVPSSCNGSVFLTNGKLQFIYSVLKELLLWPSIIWCHIFVAQRKNAFIPLPYDPFFLWTKRSLLTHYHTIPHFYFDTPKTYGCGKQCEKRRNCLDFFFLLDALQNVVCKCFQFWTV